jgi:predicted Fe-Mo cluster-binding NifX family protein
MKLAIPIRNERVSPVFDSASRLLVIELQGDEAVSRSEIPIREGGPGARSALLHELGVSTLICGAISNRTAMKVERLGIELLPWIVGDIDEVIEAYCRGTLDSEGFVMPGCRQTRRRTTYHCQGRRGQGAGGRRRAGGRRNGR